MEDGDIVSYAALAVSIFSVVTSFYFGLRDRVKVSTSCKYYPAHPEYDREHLKIRVVNRGRRVAVLTMFGGDTIDGRWQGEALGEKGAGLRLAENEFYDREFYREDVEAVAPDVESEFSRLWFEDSLGRRHIVKGSKGSISSLKHAKPL
ncbi:hypothetical protein [Alloalcanivorax venustensis]|uniref:hypothetical protein n=1 Tax=Alloalcanivorax venustensis TaxID=172371 RepID=UPI0039C06FA9